MENLEPGDKDQTFFFFFNVVRALALHVANLGSIPATPLWCPQTCQESSVQSQE